MVPLSTPPIQCTAGLKICGHTETTQQCQGGRGGGTLSQGSSKHPFQESVSTILSPIEASFPRVQATACLFWDVKQLWTHPAAWLDNDQL